MTQHNNSKFTNGTKVSIEDFGFDENSPQDNDIVKMFTFETENLMTIQILTYGAIIKSIKVPNRLGKVDDVLLGFDTLQQYKNERYPKLGSVLDFYQPENAENTGTTDDHLSTVNWKYYLKNSTLTLTHLNKTVLYTIAFEIFAENSINISFGSKSNSPHFANLSSNLFFNLAGHGTTRDHLYKQRIVLNADKYLVPNCGDTESSISKCCRVGGTGYDLRVPHRIGSFIAKSDAFGYNHNFILTRDLSDDELSFNCRISDFASGRSMEIFSNGFVAKLDTANEWPSTHKKQVFYKDYDAKRSYEQIRTLVDDGNLSVAGSDIFSDTSKQCSDAADDLQFSAELSGCSSEISSVCCIECRKSSLPLSLPLSLSKASVNSDISSVCCIDCQIAKDANNITPQNDGNNEKLEDLAQKHWTLLHKSTQNANCNECTYYKQYDLNNVSGINYVNNRTGTKPATNDIDTHSVASLSTISTVQCFGCKQFENRNEIHGKGKSIYRMQDAICVNVLQYPPDENCCSEFSNRCIKPNETHVHQILYKFKTMD